MEKNGKKAEVEKKESIFKKLGPGIITGAADDDPSGITTYSQIGATYGLKYVWLSFWLYPFMTFFQEICARIGAVTRKGLMHSLKIKYSKIILFPILIVFFIGNFANIGADLQGMVAATQLIIPLPFWLLWLIFAVVSWSCTLFLDYKKIAQYLKWLTLALFAYVITGVLSIHSFEQVKEVAMAVINPTITFSKEHLLLIVAALGTTISPYLFFWQTSEEVEEEAVARLEAGRFSINKFIKNMRFDTMFGMLVSNLIMFSIILTTADFLHANGVTSIETAADAAKALIPLAGDFAGIIFALGVIGTGLLAIPVLAASSAYAIAEYYEWREGLHLQPHQAKKFYKVVTLSIFGSFSVSLLPISPIEALVYTAVFLGLISPILMTLIMGVSSDKKIMGEHKNSLLSSIGGWSATLLMYGAAITLVFSFFW